MKVYRSSQMHKILNRSVHGLEMHKFGLPYYCAAGIFSETNYEGSVDLMLAAVDCYSDVVHPVSYMKNGTCVQSFRGRRLFLQTLLW